MPGDSFSTYVCDTIQAAAPWLELRTSESVSPYTGPLKGMPGTLETLCLTKPQSLLFFIARSCGISLPGTGTLGWRAWCEVGSLHPQGKFP